MVIAARDSAITVMAPITATAGIAIGDTGYGRYGYRYYRPYYGGHHRYYGHRYPYRRFQTESDG